MSKENQRAAWRKATAKYRTTDKGIASVRKSVSSAKKREPHKTNARVTVYKHVKKGLLKKPTLCEINEKTCMGIIEGHHEDYSKPLDVRWLCKFHHTRLHKNELN